MRERGIMEEEDLRNQDPAMIKFVINFTNANLIEFVVRFYLDST